MPLQSDSKPNAGFGGEAHLRGAIPWTQHDFGGELGKPTFGRILTNSPLTVGSARKKVY
jgi:hypothetical protein